ncbi:hypothetical protein HELRODRAFT_65459 [Helobdella robusta]|uniref:Uncharacterized protein n=1 Tax=Helobdella robusta TaxID=6412 RepID=T1FY80_HELRO|nr:hypothetical protein HELRODRAFT_65459 [Helobdella robusta]ESO02011.1 hypothetical protein HELRODRAFT_65459 [Helobdella robusta]
MKKYYIRNTSVVCNDGSTPSYFLRKSTEPRWIIFLEGWGWLCFDKNTCTNRWRNSPDLMSSKFLPSFIKGQGIQSNDENENPFIWNGNHVYVPYCSSDLWSGSFKSLEKDGFSFMGALIIEEVIKDIYIKIIFDINLAFGSDISAGGTGVLLNIDSVARMIRNTMRRLKIKTNPQLTNYKKLTSDRVVVKGIADSGWFIENDQTSFSKCTDSLFCSPVEVIIKAIRYWNTVIPLPCRYRYINNPWKCFFGHHIYPTLLTEVFVVQNLFDEAQIIMNNVGVQSVYDQQNQMRNLGVKIKSSLSSVKFMFVPACLSHAILLRSDWRIIEIESISLPELLYCWGKHNKRDNILKYKNMNHYNLMDRCQWPQCNLSCPKFKDAHSSYDNVFSRFQLDSQNLSESFGVVNNMLETR